MQHNRRRAYEWILWTASVAAAAGSATAGPPPHIIWQTDVEQAWKLCQHGRRPLLVFVTADHCAYCEQMKKVTYANAAIATVVNDAFVPLVINGGSPSPLLKDLHVSAFPATFVISSRAVVIDRIDGYVAPETLCGRLATARGTALAVADTPHR